MSIPKDIQEEFNDVSDNTLKLKELSNEELTFKRSPEVKLSGRGKVGTVYYCPNYDCKIYWNERNEDKHLLGIGNGYAISREILLTLEREGVKKILIGERKSRDVLEFEFNDYMNYSEIEGGLEFEHDEVQWCIPKDKHVKRWNGGFDSRVITDADGNKLE